MSINIRSYDRPQDVVADMSVIQDGDIVLLPNRGSVLIRAKSGRETPLRKITRDLDEPGDSGDDAENLLVLSQPRYKQSLEVALAVVNQSWDTIIPYYNPRFRLLDHYIPDRTRERTLYHHATIVERPGWEVLQVWYETSEPTVESFIGLIFHKPDDGLWSPTHTSGRHSGISLGRYPTSHQAAQELIRFDLAATRATVPQESVSDDEEPNNTAGPIAYEPNLED